MSQVEDDIPYWINPEVNHALKVNSKVKLKFIGLTGSMFSGKSTAAHAISQIEPDAYILPFAGTLKGMLMTLGLSYADVASKNKDIPNELLCGKTPRHAMQTLGTEWRDMIGRDLWIKAWDKKVAELDSKYNIVVRHAPVIADDVRFTHEAEHIQSLGGVVIKIRRECLEPKLVQHVSEQGIEDNVCNAVVYNDGTLQDLRINIVSCLEELLTVSYVKVDNDD